MKEVKAFINKCKVEAVVHALHRVEGITGLSVSKRDGYGVNWAHADVPTSKQFRSGFKIEVVCNDGIASEVVDAIQEAAHTGMKGDGIIYVTNVELVTRIASKECGENAV